MAHLDLDEGFLEAAEVAGEDDDVRALGRQLARDTATEAFGRAGDENGLRTS